MDDALSRFVDETGCDPSFARDLLEGKEGDFDEALKAFHEFSLGAVDETKQNPKPPAKPQRGISVVNSDIVFKARTKVIEKESQYERFEEITQLTFVLPDLSCYPRDFGDFLREDLIETSALVSLEQSGQLNWWADVGICQRLVPLATVGDGNCLLHAASLGMWGFHDRLLTLRNALYKTLTGDLVSGAIKRRWRLQQYQRNMEAGGLVYSEDEWEKEWAEVLRLASANRKKMFSSSKTTEEQSTLQSINDKKETNSGHKEADHLIEPCCGTSKDELACQEGLPDKITADNVDESIPSEEVCNFEHKCEEGTGSMEGAFESLEEIHVFVLAYVLQRPIIIIADKYLRDFSGDPIAPIPFGGIFLPYECPISTCLKTPLILAFESAHFSAVVASDETTKQGDCIAAIPVVSQDLEMIPIHFNVDPGEDFDWNTLNVTTNIPENLSLGKQQKVQLLDKYLDIVNIKVPKHVAQQFPNSSNAKLKQNQEHGLMLKQKEVINAGEKRPSKECSWLNNQFLKVGNLSGKFKGAVESNCVCAARLKTNEKPDYYDEMIKNYIVSARIRFQERKKIQALKKLETQSPLQLCITQGCQMYGRADTNYLCSGCFKAQKKVSESGNYSQSSSGAPETCSAKPLKSSLPPPPPSYVPYDLFSKSGSTTMTNSLQNTASSTVVQPPSYAEACQSNTCGDQLSTVRVNPKCLTEGCKFYGSREKNGFCSSCFKTTN